MIGEAATSRKTRNTAKDKRGGHCRVAHEICGGSCRAGSLLTMLPYYLIGKGRQGCRYLLQTSDARLFTKAIASLQVCKEAESAAEKCRVWCTTLLQCLRTPLRTSPPRGHTSFISFGRFVSSIYQGHPVKCKTMNTAQHSSSPSFNTRQEFRVQWQGCSIRVSLLILPISKHDAV